MTLANMSITLPPMIASFEVVSGNLVAHTRVYTISFTNGQWSSDYVAGDDITVDGVETY